MRVVIESLKFAAAAVSFVGGSTVANFANLKIELSQADMQTAKTTSEAHPLSATLDPISKALSKMKELGPLSRSDTPELRKQKLNAAKALRLAAIAGGKPLLSIDEINRDVAHRRGNLEER